MTHDDMLLACKTVCIDANDFFIDVKLPPIKTDLWRKENKIPNSVSLQFSSFIQKIIHRNSDPIFIKMKNAFFVRAHEAGLKIKDNKVELSLSKDGVEITISNDEMQLVRFIL